MTRQTGLSEVIPNILYDDAHAAIDFLRKAFGFEAKHVYEGDGGTVAHAELTFGNGMVMLGSRVRGPEGGEDAPLRWEGNSCVYVITDAVDEHHARAVAAGAEIVRPPRDEDYGGRGYVAKDAEGNLWCFGSYRPEV